MKYSYPVFVLCFRTIYTESSEGTRTFYTFEPDVEVSFIILP